MEYYSAMKKNEILPFTITWMDLQSIVLSEITQAKEGKYHMVSYMLNLKNKINQHTKQIWETNPRLPEENQSGRLTKIVKRLKNTNW